MNPPPIHPPNVEPPEPPIPVLHSAKPEQQTLLVLDDEAISMQSSASSHALDDVLLPRAPSQSASPASSANTSGNNTADELAYLNMCEPNCPRYQDIEGQKVFAKSDRRSYKEKSWGHMLHTIIRGRAMPLKPLGFAVFWAIASVFITWGTSKGYTARDGPCRWWCTPLAIDGDALSYVGFALFLLTSFRVQEAYGRYMEAVRVWTCIAGTITSFTKYVVQAFPDGRFHRGDRERILGYLVAFPVTLKRQLRGEKDLRELKDVLSVEDLAELQNTPDMPSHCLYILSGYCLHAKAAESELPQTFIVHLIRWIADLAGAADTCMQIKTMPAPYSYITHLNTFLALWLFFLPFALVETTGWITIVIVAFISYGILGVVSNAAELEDPFGSDYNDLPLGRLAQNIQNSVAAIYHAAKNQSDILVREVRDDDLRSSRDYWLKGDSDE